MTNNLYKYATTKVNVLKPFFDYLRTNLPEAQKLRQTNKDAAILSNILDRDFYSTSVAQSENRIPFSSVFSKKQNPDQYYVLKAKDPKKGYPAFAEIYPDSNEKRVGLINIAGVDDANTWKLFAKLLDSKDIQRKYDYLKSDDLIMDVKTGDLV